MSIIDSTTVNVPSKTAPDAAAPATTPADKSGGDGGGGAAKPAEAARPEANDLINGILDKHGLSSPEELAEFLELGAETLSQIGDFDPGELVKAKTTLDQYQREWAKKEQERLKEAETPEQTIARLEREKADSENKAAQRDRAKRQAETAKKAVKVYNDTITAAVVAEKDIPEEYVPFVKEFLGVGSPVNEVNIQDRAAVKKMAKEFGIKRMREFEQAVIKRYRAGKAEIPAVPSSAGEAAPVLDEKQPKNLNEARATLRERMTAHFAKR